MSATPLLEPAAAAGEAGRARRRRGGLLRTLDAGRDAVALVQVAAEDLGVLRVADAGLDLDRMERVVRDDVDGGAAAPVARRPGAAPAGRGAGGGPRGALRPEPERAQRDAEDALALR